MPFGSTVQERFGSDYAKLITRAKEVNVIEGSQALPGAFTNTAKILSDMLEAIGAIRRNKEKCFSLAQEATETVKKMKALVEKSSSNSLDTALTEFNSAFETMTDGVRSIAGRNFLMRLFGGDFANEFARYQRDLGANFGRFQVRSQPQPPESPDEELGTAAKIWNNARVDREKQQQRNEEELLKMNQEPSRLLRRES